MSTPEKKPPITCHVLDTIIGKPGAQIPVTLTLHTTSMSTTTSQSKPQFTATTNSDGRVTSWAPAASSTPFTESSSLEAVWTSLGGAGDSKWSLKFDTERYFGEQGVKAFFPEVEVVFLVSGEQWVRKEHFHVPVLLGPFGYTTYRGS